jgi:heme a synthase
MRVTQTPAPPAQAQPQAQSTNPLLRFWRWFAPSAPTGHVKVLAWISLVLEIVLVGTGGAVRLTASGLGCPTWPQCSPGSFTTTPELGIHGLIEFSNRVLSFTILPIVVILMFLVILRMRRTRRDLFVLTLVQGLSIPFQAVLGGITVLSGLNPYVVGSHFIVSMLLVVLATVLVYRVLTGRRGAAPVTPLWYRVGVIVTFVFVWLTVIFGILTSGAGPHAGDNSDAKALAPRNGLPPVTIQNIHSIPAYVLFGLTLALFVAAWIVGNKTWGRVRLFVTILLAVEVAQIIVGVTQAKDGLPIDLVEIHLVLAAILVGAMTAFTVSQRSGADAALVRPDATFAPS